MRNNSAVSWKRIHSRVLLQRGVQVGKDQSISSNFIFVVIEKGIKTGMEILVEVMGAGNAVSERMLRG